MSLVECLLSILCVRVCVLQLAVDKTVTGIVYGATNILASLTQGTMTNVFTVCA